MHLKSLSREAVSYQQSAGSNTEQVRMGSARELESHLFLARDLCFLDSFEYDRL